MGLKKRQFCLKMADEEGYLLPDQPGPGTHKPVFSFG